MKDKKGLKGGIENLPCEDHVERERELESIGLAKEADEKLGPGLNSFICIWSKPVRI